MNIFKPTRIVLLLALCCLAGCNSSSNDAEFVKSANESNLEKISNAYHLYASRFEYTGPKSKEEFKKFLKTNDQIDKNLKMMGIDRQNIDEYFISENDGKEFAFRWGVFIDPDLEKSNEPLVFETEGMDGTRLVMLSSREVLEVTDDEKYQELLNREVLENEAGTDEDDAEGEETEEVSGQDSEADTAEAEASN